MEMLNNVGLQLVDQINKQQAVQSLSLGKALEQVDIPLVKEYRVVKDFMNLPVNDPKEKALKKVMAAAMVTAAEKGVLPFPVPKKASSIASVVDEGLTHMKVAYKVAQGKMNPVEATETVINHGIARAVSVVKKVASKVVDKVVPVVADAVVDAVSTVFPPVQLVKPFVQKTVPYVSHTVKTAVHAGIQTLAEAAKPVVKTIATTVVSVGRKVAPFLKSLFA